MESPFIVLYRAVRGRLTSTPEAWGQRVYHDLAPAEAQTPYVVFSTASARERNRLRKRDAEFVVLVRVVSDALDEGLVMAERTAALLNDAGDQDIANGDLFAGSDWRILTITQERMVQYVEMVNAKRLHHCAAEYRVVMEAI
jgi:hypothetical protein